MTETTNEAVSDSPRCCPQERQHYHEVFLWNGGYWCPFLEDFVEEHENTFVDQSRRITILPEDFLQIFDFNVQRTIGGGDLVGTV